MLDFLKTFTDIFYYKYAVRAYIDILNTDPELTDQQVYDKLIARKIPEPIVWELITLFPILAGRLYTTTKNPQGGVIESYAIQKKIELQESQCAMLITQNIDRLKQPDTLKSVALRSTELA